MGGVIFLRAWCQGLPGQRDDDKDPPWVQESKQEPD